VNSSIELVIFDIVSTLIEDHNEVPGAFLEALRANHIQVTEDEIKEWKGGSKRQVITHFVERQFGRCRNLPLIDRTYGEFQFRLEQRYGSGGIVKINGAEETLQWLRDRKMKIATSTGFYREVRDRILRELQWEKAFDANVCSDEVAKGRPAPDIIQLAMKLTASPIRPTSLTSETPRSICRPGTSAGCGVVIGVLTGMPHARKARAGATYPPYCQHFAAIRSFPVALTPHAKIQSLPSSAHSHLCPPALTEMPVPDHNSRGKSGKELNG
jgi:phosphonatase-like hydrolase